MPVRLPVVAGLLALGLTVGVVALPVVLHHGGRVGGPGRVFAAGTSTLPPSQPSSSSAAVGVLRDWDRRRAAAWADGDAGALRALYTRRSAAGSADVALLQEYAARGLAVRDLRMQLLSVRVLVDRPRQLVLEVIDRVAGATAVRATDPAASRRLPADIATTRVLLLRRVGERWLMARVSSAGR